MIRNILFILFMGNVSFVIELRKRTGFNRAAAVADERETRDRLTMREPTEVRTKRITMKIRTVFA